MVVEGEGYIHAENTVYPVDTIMVVGLSTPMDLASGPIPLLSEFMTLHSEWMNWTRKKE